ncbi:MAG TPA: uroporphyrinogen-III synthase [Pseudolabrys sp.]|jgi:uroporphyrinogen-III synthase|nr:uroporphyrinogen-III synthase [Pseudolabrys sp.]
MRLVITRPQADSERTAAALRAHGHDVLLAPLMRVEMLPADLMGDWSAVIVTSANAPAAIAGNPVRDVLVTLPLYAVGRRSAEAAQAAGFARVTSADGDVGDLVKLIGEHRANAKGPLLYLAGENRAADLITALAARGIAAEMRVVYRAVAAPYPPALIAALRDGSVDGVLHYSKRSAENYLAGARAAGITAAALTVRHFCLSAQIAAPLADAGAAHISTAPHASEAALIELLTPSPG